MTLEDFLILITVCYVAQGALFILGVRRARDLMSNASPFVSVVVAARNEEMNIMTCLESVTRQTYPAEKFEIIVANDDSSDRTAEICNDFAARYSNIRAFTVKEDSKLRGKANALAQAIDMTKGEVVLITDADCEVPATWVEYTAKRFSLEVGLVGGMTMQKATKTFEGIQSLDWAYILGVASSSVAWGLHLGSIGNNLSFRKEAYDAVGGYREMKFSVTEDYTLVQSIINTKKWKYLYPVDPQLLVWSKPCTTWKDLTRQKHRWGKGGLDMKFMGFIVMAVTCTTIASAFGMLFWNGVLQCVIALMTKSTVDYAFLYQVLSKLKQTSELKYFWWFELYFTVYVMLLPLVVVFGGKIVWKGRNY
ncbi:MAG: glycosyltransferase [Ignavibacteriales bacterium]|nr:glycosyltransferase [Ignavibacteriales bacterium]